MIKKKTEKFQRRDMQYLSQREKVANAIGRPDLWSMIDQFGLYVGTQTLGTRLAVYEIMKECMNVPGHIAEFGCWHGSNLLFMAKVIQLLQPNTYKYIYGFDSFEGLRTFAPEDKDTLDNLGQYQGDEGTLHSMIELFEMDEWVCLVKGVVDETIPVFAKEHPGLMLSLAYIDLDLYEPCKLALKFSHGCLVSGGIIVLDEAMMRSWPGEGQALAEFLSEHGSEYYTKNIPFARQPTVYLVKK
ncbi:TylF/MycF/NovP-related O-methyltransferase [Planctomycetota bacterium]